MLYKGDVAIDDRGSVSFVNDFDPSVTKRFYVVSNHQKGFVRAWHGHQKEGKYVFVVSGAIKIGVISMKDDRFGKTYVLSAIKPQVLYIPPGNYNGFKTLTDDAQVMFFSTLTMEKSSGDDYRKPANEWDILEVEER